jgi:hypothetical protein
LALRSRFRDQYASFIAARTSCIVASAATAACFEPSRRTSHTASGRLANSAQQSEGSNVASAKKLVILPLSEERRRFRASDYRQPGCSIFQFAAIKIGAKRGSLDARRS